MPKQDNLSVTKVNSHSCLHSTTSSWHLCHFSFNPILDEEMKRVAQQRNLKFNNDTMPKKVVQPTTWEPSLTGDKLWLDARQ